MPQSTHSAIAAVELLWNERQCNSGGLMHRITIPVVARELPGTLGAELTQVLSDWWSAPHALTPSASVTSVVADVQLGILSDHTLQLIVTTDEPIDAEDLAGMRMIRDLRRAVRNLRLTRLPALAPEPAGLALAA